MTNFSIIGNTAGRYGIDTADMMSFAGVGSVTDLYVKIVNGAQNLGITKHEYAEIIGKEAREMYNDIKRAENEGMVR